MELVPDGDEEPEGLFVEVGEEERSVIVPDAVEVGEAVAVRDEVAL